MEAGFASRRNDGPTIEAVRAAKLDLGNSLMERGIHVALGIGNKDGKLAIAMRIQPEVDKLTNDQLEELKAIQEHNGVPVDVVVISQIRPL
ncbi:MAG: hypothetical protein KDD62_08945 [Bdellovibrionales bacterium]|nr:hypothetical protein [Bdellovibrionales bacterium]